MSTAKLNIQGMSCGHCVGAVKQALDKVEGVEVEQVQVGSASIRVDGEATLQGAISAIADAGYQAAVSHDAAAGSAS